ncbi:MAG: flavodoxin family protein [Porphyrobacter sp.]|nr:flavodoxin family protein [Porphyrobacter sp.]
MDDPAPEQHLLIAWHSRTGASEAMAAAAAEGAGGRARLMRADGVTADDLLAARGYLFACPENLATMSGLMKEMFDRTYYAVLGQVEGRPYATIIAAGSDGEGAQRQIDRIATGWRLRRVADPVIVNFAAQTPEAIAAPKQVPDKVLKQCRELGSALAEGLNLGIF